MSVQRVPIIVHVASRVRIDTTTGCWNWNGNSFRDGYGRLQTKGVTSQLAHRIAYETYRHPIPSGLHIDHLCRNCRCVNPWHLEVVTAHENTMRGCGPTAVNAKKTHCKNGHAFTADNTKTDKHGRRECRTCLRAKSFVRNRARTTEENRRYWDNRVAKRRTA